MYRSIFVPLDGSPFSEHALPFALSIARQAGAMVQLAHVHVPVEPMHRDSTPLLDATLDNQLQERESAYLEELAQRLAATWQVRITTALLEGPTVIEALCSHLHANDFDMIAITTHGRGMLSRFWLGSVTDALIRRVTLPIMVIRPHGEQPDPLSEPTLNHMLVPLDGTPLSEQVLDTALRLGRGVGMRYTLLQVIEQVIASYGPEKEAFRFDKGAREQQHASARAYLERLAQGLRAEGLQVETATVEATQPAFAILDYARDNGIDLIAMETHGRGGLARLLMGSVADKVVRGATMPVLLQRPCAENRD